MENNNLAGLEEKWSPPTIKGFDASYSDNVIFSESREHYIKNHGQMTNNYRLKSPVIFWNELNTDEKLDIVMLILTCEYPGISMSKGMLESVGLDKYITDPKEIK